MIRCLSAFFFIAAMMVLVVFQQPALAYCSHTNHFFIDDCGCEKVPENQCPHCPQEKPQEKPFDPCDDCSEKIQFEVDDLVWFELTIDAPKIVCPLAVDGAAERINLQPAAPFAVFPTRPPPPPRGISLFLWHSVFRL